MYAFELFEFGINFGFDEVEGLGNALVFSGNGVEFVKRADGEEADKEGCENDGFHDIN